MFYFLDLATTKIYTLSLHDALPIFPSGPEPAADADPRAWIGGGPARSARRARLGDRKSTRLNSSHQIISYAVFCLKKKKHIRSEKPSTRQCKERRPI